MFDINSGIVITDREGNRQVVIDRSKEDAIQENFPHDIRSINEQLARNYGSDLYTRPNFRLIWGPTQREAKFGTFEDFYGPIFIRRWTGIRDVEKYPTRLWGECWILEKLMVTPPPNVHNWNGYESVWSFKNAETGEPIFPIWKFTNLLCQVMLYGQKTTLQQKLDEQEDAWKKEKQEVFEYLDDQIPWKSLQLKQGEGIVVPNMYRGQK